jgi:hypothetical protein
VENCGCIDGILACLGFRVSGLGFGVSCLRV